MGDFSLSGGVEVFGFISPTNTNDTYPVIDPLYGIDGFRNVNTLSDLNNIPGPRRRAGMVVGVSGGTTYYKLNPSPWNYSFSDWSTFNTGGGSVSGAYLPLSGGTVTGNTTFTTGLTVNGVISATTYQNLPTDIRVTGGTYSNGTATFTNNTGGTITVTGFLSNATTAVTLSSNVLSVTSSGGSTTTTTINAATGGTYSNGTITLSGTGTLTTITGLFTGSTGPFGISNSGGTYTFYSTLTLAMSAATSGQVIEMFADVIETSAVTITLKSGVNINGNGHTYTLDTTTTTNAFIDGGVGVVMNFSNITLVRKGSGAGAIIGLSVSGNRIVGFSTFLKVESNNSYGITNYGGAVFSGYINGFTVTSTGTASTGIYLIRAYIDGCNSVATANGIQVIIGTITNSYGESTGSGSGIEITNSGYSSNCNGKSNTGYGIYTVVYLNDSTGYSAGNYGIYCPSAIVSNCTGISAASQGIWGYSNRITNSSAISTGGVASLIQNGVINNSTFYSTVNSAVNIFNNTTAYNSTFSTLAGATTVISSNASGTPCLKNCVIINDWNNTGGHGIPANASLVVANSSIKVANTSANCLYSSSPVTMKFANNVFEGSTTPVNINITQGITNTHDNYGNILI